MIISNIIYCVFIIKGSVHPTLMTWILFFFAVSLSFGTYWSSGKHSFLNNICNTGDLISVLLIIVIIVFWGKNIRFNINILEIICILFSFIILIFWRVTKSHEISNIFLQVIMIIAYFPTFHQLWISYKSSESIIYWILVLFSGISGFITGTLVKDPLAMIYSGRSVVMVFILIFLILRLTIKKNRLYS